MITIFLPSSSWPNQHFVDQTGPAWIQRGVKNGEDCRWHYSCTVYLIQSAVWNKSRGGKFHLPVKVGKEPLICRRENVEQSLCNHCAFWRTQLIPRQIGFPLKNNIKFSPKQCNNFSEFLLTWVGKGSIQREIRNIRWVGKRGKRRRIEKKMLTVSEEVRRW